GAADQWGDVRRAHRPDARGRAPPARRHPRRTLLNRRFLMKIDVDRNAELLDRWEALTFDDVVIVPGYSDVLPDTVDTSATFAADIVLQVPIVRAGMDKVTEARGPGGQGGEGQGPGGAHGHRHGARGWHRRDPPQPVHRRAGGGGAEG